MTEKTPDEIIEKTRTEIELSIKQAVNEFENDYFSGQLNGFELGIKLGKEQAFEEYDKGNEPVSYARGVNDGVKLGEKKAREKILNQINDLNVFPEGKGVQLLKLVKELQSTNNDCDCKMFIGGSGKLCPDCEEVKR